MKRLALFVIAATAFAAPAAAQPLTPNAPANFGEVTLTSNFSDDPRVVTLRAGGDINANTVGNQCRGFVTAAPDYKVNYTGGSLPLIISVAASADTTLVINGPDGRWYCDDDGGENGSNPAVRFNNPRTGRYDIYVGTYSAGASQQARLHISEVTSQ